MTNYEEESHGSGGEVRARDEGRVRDGRERAATPDRTVDSRDASVSLSSDTAFKLLSSRRRRDLIRCLDDVGDRVDLRELSERVAAVENGVTAAALTYDQRKRVYVSLRQTHLPKLSNAGTVEYDPDRSVIVPGDGIGALRLLLDTVEAAMED